MSEQADNRFSYSPRSEAWRRFRSDKLAVGALVMLLLLLVISLFAPLLANPRPLLEYTPENGLKMPFIRSFFAPESTEFCIEQLFNYALTASVLVLPFAYIVRKKKFAKILDTALLLLLALPFIFTERRRA